MTPRNGSTSKAAKAAPKAASKAARPKAAPAKAAPAKAAPAKAAPAKAAPAKAAKPAPKPAPAPAPKPAPAPAPAVPVNKVAKKDHKRFETRLLEERGACSRSSATSSRTCSSNQRDSSGDLSRLLVPMADLGTDAMEREKAFLFASAEGRAIYDVDEALRRSTAATTAPASRAASRSRASASRSCRMRGCACAARSAEKAARR
jgi:hypothetical protein